MRLVINGNTPAKKNNRTPFVRNGRMMNFPNKKYVEWEKEAIATLATQFKGQFDGPVIIVAEFYNKDKRGRDIDNQLSSILDMLVKSGLLAGDNCFQVPEIHGIFGGVDPKNPRAEVTIEEVER